MFNTELVQIEKNKEGNSKTDFSTLFILFEKIWLLWCLCKYTQKMYDLQWSKAY